MKILDVPIYNDDGSIKFTQQVSPQEAQALLQFAINFMAATGLNVTMNDRHTQQELND
jgi:hypothetical protein